VSDMKKDYQVVSCCWLWMMLVCCFLMFAFAYVAGERNALKAQNDAMKVVVERLQLQLEGLGVTVR
jgi:hypothetical protein